MLVRVLLPIHAPPAPVAACEVCTAWPTAASTWICKTTYAVIGWLVGWAVLLRGRDVPEKGTYWISGILVALGFVLTFPPVRKLLGA